MPSSRPTRGPGRGLATVGLVVLLAAAAGCAIPPDYPPDEQHVDVRQSRECLVCHVARAQGPRPHPSHFDDHDQLKVTRRNCLDCHDMATPENASRRDSTSTGGPGGGPTGG